MQFSSCAAKGKNTPISSIPYKFHHWTYSFQTIDTKEHFHFRSQWMGLNLQLKFFEETLQSDAFKDILDQFCPELLCAHSI